ncbi:hypothetical protein ACFLWB_02200 [Chloroflexota bacterium]
MFTGTGEIVIGGAGIATYLGMVGTGTLILSLLIKELASAGSGWRQTLSRNINIIIFPLLYVLAVTVFIRVWEIVA